MAIKIARTIVAVSLCFDRILRDRPGIFLMDIEWSSREDNAFRLVDSFMLEFQRCAKNRCLPRF